MPVTSLEQILNAFTPKELADALACPYQTAAAMKRRGSVGQRHWPLFLLAVRARGYDIDGDSLIRLCASASERRPTDKVPPHQDDAA